LQNQHERHENSQLRADNDKLRAENMRYKEALSSASCPNCGGPAALGEMSFDEHHLRVENARLRDEIDRLSAIAAKYIGKPMVPFPVLSNPTLGAVGAYGAHPADIFGTAELPPMRAAAGVDAEKQGVVVELAVAAMEELVRMARMDGPLWTADGRLDEEEYARMFGPRGVLGPKQYGLVSEASRDAAVVIMTPASLVEILMDVVSRQSSSTHHRALYFSLCDRSV
jgi:homeobox-leucine zipper protein